MPSLTMAMPAQGVAVPGHSPRFASRTSRRVGEGTRNVLARLRADEGANISNISAGALTVAVVIVGAVVAMILINQLLPSYVGAARGTAENLTTADWGDPVANGISPTMGMLVALGALFAIAGLVFWAIKLRKSG